MTFNGDGGRSGDTWPMCTSELVRRVRRAYESREYQDTIAAKNSRQERYEELSAATWYRSQLRQLSSEHVSAVQAGCYANLAPITTTEIQRKIFGWDGAVSVFLLGGTGVGKTYAATWMAMKAARRGRSCMATTPYRLCRMSQDAFARASGVSVLILDQLHTLRAPSGKPAPGWQVTPTIDMIDYRYENGLTTIAAGTVSADVMFGQILGHDSRRRFGLRVSSTSTKISTTTHSTNVED